MSTKTLAQQKTLAIIPKFTGTLSILGSTWIITEICTEREKLRNVYHRLMLAMSTYDVLESIWNVASTWPIPQNTENIWGASGNQQTCTTQGFFLQLGLGVPIYNASLSVYYLLVIRFSFHEQRISHQFEPIMHGLVFVSSFGTALASLLLDLYNNANLWCWIAPLPADCLDSQRYGSTNNPNPCIRGDNAWTYRWAFYFGPLWFCILVSMVALAMVYWAVMKREAATVRYRHPASTRNVASEDNTTGDPSSRRRATIVMAKHVSRRLSHLVRRENEEQRNPRSREVLNQAVWYVVTFYLTHVFSTTNRILQQTRGKTYFPLVVCHAFFDPFQGFLNFLVYRRPRYLKYRRTNPQKSRWFAVKSTLRFSYIETRKSKRLRMQQQYQYSSSSVQGGAESSERQLSVENETDGERPRSRRSGLLLFLDTKRNRMSSVAENQSESFSGSSSEIGDLDFGRVQFVDVLSDEVEVPRKRLLTAVEEEEHHFEETMDADIVCNGNVKARGEEPLNLNFASATGSNVVNQAPLPVSGEAAQQNVDDQHVVSEIAELSEPSNPRRVEPPVESRTAMYPGNEPINPNWDTLTASGEKGERNTLNGEAMTTDRP